MLERCRACSRRAHVYSSAPYSRLARSSFDPLRVLWLLPASVELLVMPHARAFHATFVRLLGAPAPPRRDLGLLLPGNCSVAPTAAAAPPQPTTLQAVPASTPHDVPSPPPPTELAAPLPVLLLLAECLRAVESRALGPSFLALCLLEPRATPMPPAWVPTPHVAVAAASASGVAATMAAPAPATNAIAATVPFSAPHSTTKVVPVSAAIAVVHSPRTAPEPTSTSQQRPPTPPPPPGALATSARTAVGSPSTLASALLGSSAIPVRRLGSPRRAVRPATLHDEQPDDEASPPPPTAPATLRPAPAGATARTPLFVAIPTLSAPTRRGSVTMPSPSAADVGGGETSAGRGDLLLPIGSPRSPRTPLDAPEAPLVGTTVGAAAIPGTLGGPFEGPTPFASSLLSMSPGAASSASPLSSSPIESPLRGGAGAASGQGPPSLSADTVLAASPMAAVPLGSPTEPLPAALTPPSPPPPPPPPPAPLTTPHAARPLRPIPQPAGSSSRGHGTSPLASGTSASSYSAHLPGRARPPTPPPPRPDGWAASLETVSRAGGPSASPSHGLQLFADVAAAASTRTVPQLSPTPPRAMAVPQQPHQPASLAPPLPASGHHPDTATAMATLLPGFLVHPQHQHQSPLSSQQARRGAGAGHSEAVPLPGEGGYAVRLQQQSHAPLGSPPLSASPFALSPLGQSPSPLLGPASPPTPPRHAASTALSTAGPASAAQAPFPSALIAGAAQARVPSPVPPTGNAATVGVRSPVDAAPLPLRRIAACPPTTARLGTTPAAGSVPSAYPAANAAPADAAAAATAPAPRMCVDPPLDIPPLFLEALESRLASVYRQPSPVPTPTPPHTAETPLASPSNKGTATVAPPAPPACAPPTPELVNFVIWTLDLLAQAHYAVLESLLPELDLPTLARRAVELGVLSTPARTAPTQQHVATLPTAAATSSAPEPTSISSTTAAEASLPPELVDGLLTLTRAQLVYVAYNAASPLARLVVICATLAGSPVVPHRIALLHRAATLLTRTAARLGPALGTHALQALGRLAAGRAVAARFASAPHVVAAVAAMAPSLNDSDDGASLLRALSAPTPMGAFLASRNAPSEVALAEALLAMRQARTAPFRPRAPSSAGSGGSTTPRRPQSLRVVMYWRHRGRVAVRPQTTSSSVTPAGVSPAPTSPSMPFPQPRSTVPAASPATLDRDLAAAVRVTTLPPPGPLDDVSFTASTGTTTSSTWSADTPMLDAATARVLPAHRPPQPPASPPLPLPLPAGGAGHASSAATRSRASRSVAAQRRATAPRAARPELTQAGGAGHGGSSSPPPHALMSVRSGGNVFAGTIEEGSGGAAVPWSDSDSANEAGGSAGELTSPSPGASLGTATPPTALAVAPAPVPVLAPEPLAPTRPAPMALPTASGGGDGGPPDMLVRQGTSSSLPSLRPAPLGGSSDVPTTSSASSNFSTRTPPSPLDPAGAVTGTNTRAALDAGEGSGDGTSETDPSASEAAAAGGAATSDDEDAEDIGSGDTSASDNQRLLEMLAAAVTTPVMAPNNGEAYSSRVDTTAALGGLADFASISNGGLVTLNPARVAGLLAMDGGGADGGAAASSPDEAVPLLDALVFDIAPASPTTASVPPTPTTARSTASAPSALHTAEAPAADVQSPALWQRITAAARSLLASSRQSADTYAHHHDRNGSLAHQVRTRRCGVVVEGDLVAWGLPPAPVSSTANSDATATAGTTASLCRGPLTDLLARLCFVAATAAFPTSSIIAAPAPGHRRSVPRPRRCPVLLVDTATPPSPVLAATPVSPPHSAASPPTTATVRSALALYFPMSRSTGALPAGAVPPAATAVPPQGLSANSHAPSEAAPCSCGGGGAVAWSRQEALLARESLRGNLLCLLYERALKAYLECATTSAAVDPRGDLSSAGADASPDIPCPPLLQAIAAVATAMANALLRGTPAFSEPSVATPLLEALAAFAPNIAAGAVPAQLEALNPTLTAHLPAASDGNPPADKMAMASAPLGSAAWRCGGGGGGLGGLDASLVLAALHDPASIPATAPFDTSVLPLCAPAPSGPPDVTPATSPDARPGGAGGEFNPVLGNMGPHWAALFAPLPSALESGTLVNGAVPAAAAAGGRGAGPFATLALPRLPFLRAPARARHIVCPPLALAALRPFAGLGTGGVPLECTLVHRRVCSRLIRGVLTVPAQSGAASWDPLECGFDDAAGILFGVPLRAPPTPGVAFGAFEGAGAPRASSWGGAAPGLELDAAPFASSSEVDVQGGSARQPPARGGPRQLVQLAQLESLARAFDPIALTEALTRELPALRAAVRARDQATGAAAGGASGKDGSGDSSRGEDEVTKGPDSATRVDGKRGARECARALLPHCMCWCHPVWGSALPWANLTLGLHCA